MSLRERILAKQDLKSTIVPVPEWAYEEDGQQVECQIEIRELSAKGRMIWREAALDTSSKEEKFKPDWPIQLIVACAFEPGTQDRVFTPEDAAALYEKSDAALGRLIEEAIVINGLGAEKPLELPNSSGGDLKSEQSAS